MKKLINNIVEYAFLLTFVFVIKILVFVDDYLLVDFATWIERLGKCMTYVLLLSLILIGSKCVCQALAPHVGVHSVVQLFAGAIFFIAAVFGFQYREKIWSLT